MARRLVADMTPEELAKQRAKTRVSVAKWRAAHPEKDIVRNRAYQARYRAANQEKERDRKARRRNDPTASLRDKIRRVLKYNRDRIETLKREREELYG